MVSAVDASVAFAVPSMDARSRDVDEREVDEVPEADLDNERAESPASRDALALLILLAGALFASLISGLLLLPSNLSFEPNECRGFRGASELALMLVWKRAIRSLADLPLFSSGRGLHACNVSWNEPVVCHQVQTGRHTPCACR